MRKSFDKLVTELETAILTSPIVYIPHHDYHLIERALTKAFDTCAIDSNEALIFFCERGVFEYNWEELPSDKSTSHLPTFFNNFVFENEKNYGIRLFLIENFIFDDNTFSNDESFRKAVAWLQLFVHQEQHTNRENHLKRTVILVNPRGDLLPPPLEKIVSVVNVDPPEYGEIQELINKKREEAKNKAKGLSLHSNEELFEIGCDNLARTLQGLQESEVTQILNTLTTDTAYGDFVPGFVRAAMKEKKRIVQKTGLLEVKEADESFDNIGGLEVLQKDMKGKSHIYHNIQRAISSGIPIPKGILIMGMPGCGKSMMAKAIAREFGVGLLRLDMNKVLGQYVGQSEQKFKRVLDLAESASPCVLWIDEIEKAFSGTNNDSGREGSDVVMRMMGMFLTWMQEHSKPVYIVATANDVMRPEFMRKGRFDEVYYVGFPEFPQVLDIYMKRIDTFKREVIKKKREISNIFTEIVFSESIMDNWAALKDAMYCLNGDNERVFTDFGKRVSKSQELSEDIKEELKILLLTDADNDPARVKDLEACVELLYDSLHFSGAEIANVVNKTIEDKFIKMMDKKEGVIVSPVIGIDALSRIVKSAKEQRLSANFDAVQEKIDDAIKTVKDPSSSSYDRAGAKEELSQFKDPISRIYILYKRNGFKSADLIL